MVFVHEAHLYYHDLYCVKAVKDKEQGFWGFVIHVSYTIN